MLGVFIDCDHSKEADSQSDSGDDTYYDSEDSCSRWMMWASVSSVITFIVEYILTCL